MRLLNQSGRRASLGEIIIQTQRKWQWFSIIISFIIEPVVGVIR